MKLRLVFDDVQKDLPKMHRYAPIEAHVEQIIRFARTASDNTRMIVHCAGGVSRSSATALVYLSARGIPPRDAIELCLAAKEAIVPHRNIVAMGDELLGLQGELLRARDYVWGKGS